MAKSSKDRFPGQLLKARVYLREHGLLDNPVIRNLDRLCETDYINQSSWPVEMLMTRVCKHQAKSMLEPNTVPFEKAHLPSRGICLGEAFRATAAATAELLYIAIAWLHVGLLAAGSAGSGKSNFIKFILIQLFPLLKSVWVTELYKAEMRHFLPVLKKIGINLVVIQPRNACINTLQPVGDPRAHAWIAVDQLCRHTGMPTRARSVLYRVVMQLYREFGLLDGDVDVYPTWFDVFIRIRDNKKLNFQARDAVLDRLGGYLASQSGAYRLAWRPEDLANIHCVFEYHAATESQKGIETSYLLRSLLTHAVQMGRVNAPFTNLCVIDDAHRFLSGGNEEEGGVTPIEELLSVIRGSGTSVFALVQSLSRVPRGVLANLSNRVMFRLATDADYRQLAADMNMTAEQREWAKRHLRPGLGVFTSADGPWREPILMDIPAYELPSVVTDAQVAASLKHLSHLPVKRATEFDNFSPHEAITLPQPPEVPTAKSGGVARRSDQSKPTKSLPAPTTVAGSASPQISGDEIAFLKAIRDHHDLPASKFRGVLGFGSDKTLRLRRTLIEKGWVKQTPVQKNAKGRASLLLSLTLQGESIFSDAHLPGEGGDA
ncbi:MAG: hypothetical protein AAGA25_12710 [Planctomycetota bacterium]